MRTLRLRLLLGTAIGTTAVLLISSVVLYALIRDALWEEFDRSLESKARSLAALLEQENDKLDLEFDEAGLPEFEPSDRAEFYQVWLGAGQVFARSPSLQGRDLRRVAGTTNEPAFRSVILPDGRRGRVVGITFVPRAGKEHRQASPPPEVTLVLGRETVRVDNTLAQLSWLLISVYLVAVVVAVGVLAWFVRRGLEPVDRLAARIADLGESDLTARIEPADIPAELLPVVDRLNDLLARLDAAFARERTFTADVAHELRTPLAGLRSMLEVALSKERESGAYRQTMTECLVVNRQMHEMVENLLGLARADARQLRLKRERVDLSHLIRESYKPLVEQAAERHLHVNWQLQEPCLLETDAAALQLVLQNILRNAVSYTDVGGKIDVTSAQQDGQVMFRVNNTGSMVSEDDADRVFDRFWRGDTSRRATGQHAGLGLALCKTLTTLLGASISASSALEGHFQVTVKFAQNRNGLGHGTRRQGENPEVHRDKE